MGSLPRSRAIPWPSLRVGAAIIGLCLSFVAVGCGRGDVEEKPVTRPVKILTIGGPNSVGWREYPGTIRGAQTAEMAFEVFGRMIGRPVKEGERVKKGAVLARLDDRDYVAQLDVAKANLQKAQSAYRRGKNIYSEDPGAISKEQLDAYRKGVFA